jgi:tetratricopeptide (TPR) repeat protein
MTRSWAQAERCFRRCAETAQQEASRGQALHCVGTALQSQGRPADALPFYRQAAQLWAGQPIVYFSIANAHKQLGQLGEAVGALQEGLRVDEASGAPGLRPLLLQLQRELLALQAGAAGGERGGGGESGGA